MRGVHRSISLVTAGASGFLTLIQSGDRPDRYVDGEWTAVPLDTIRKVVAPDQGAHVCAPQRAHDWDAGVIYCVVLPPEG